MFSTTTSYDLPCPFRFRGFYTHMEHCRLVKLDWDPIALNTNVPGKWVASKIKHNLLKVCLLICFSLRHVLKHIFCSQLQIYRSTFVEFQSDSDT